MSRLDFLWSKLRRLPYRTRCGCDHLKGGKHALSRLPTCRSATSLNHGNTQNDGLLHYLVCQTRNIQLTTVRKTLQSPMFRSP